MPSHDKDQQENTGENTGVDRILRDFAHEIQTPLNAMLGYSQLIGTSLKPGCDLDKITEYNETLKTATTRLMLICERVLNDAVAGEVLVRKEEVDAKRLALNVAETFKALAAERGVNLVCDFPANFPTLMTDPLLLSQVLSNLISNAVKFTPAGGLVKVKGEISNHDDALIFVIQDTGTGIPADLLVRMRNGEKVSTAHTHGHKGWGRGLQIVNDICLKLGAELRFEPARSGGTVAMVSVPLLG
jgi:two-component system cell cycle sensor histidine kinase PleC